MELTEPIESINKQLKELFGVDTVTGKPLFRVVWSEDQLEKRQIWNTLEGLQLLSPIVRELPKYRQWIQEKYVLERLVAVPEFQQEEIGVKVSYEPLWVFEDKRGNALPPAVWACKFCIDTVYAAMGRTGLRKYVDEEAQYPEEAREKRIKEYEEQLFGDESSLLGRTITGEAVIVPPNYVKGEK
jgi:hypothetical protein